MERKSTPLLERIFKGIFFSPLAFIWNLLHFLRRTFYDYGILKQKSFQVPIISVGNLTFGGTGKTPFTLWLAEYLQEKNKKVMILMRGYKGRLENSHGLIISGKRMAPDPIEYGDEALLFARRLENASIVVGKKRSENLSFYFPKIEPDVVLLDDGHQHIKIKRKKNILLFDATIPLAHYLSAPMGCMREGFFALKDVDLIVVSKAKIAGPEKVIALKEFLRTHLSNSIDFAEIDYKANGFYNAANDLILTTAQIKGKKIICVAGVANPKSFFKLLEDLGAEIIVTESFRDHHYFTSDEINALLSYAKEEDALIITTEKDMVRIKKIIEDDSILFLEVAVEFISGEEKVKKIIDDCFLN